MAARGGCRTCGGSGVIHVPAREPGAMSGGTLDIPARELLCPRTENHGMDVVEAATAILNYPPEAEAEAGS